MFKVGQTVVHLSHGVGKVSGIEDREFSPGKKQKFYILTIQDNGAPKKVFVPFENAGVSFRATITKAQALNILAYIALGKADGSSELTWSRRYREYMERIHSGDAMEIAKVYVTLKTMQKNSAEFSFGERKLLKHAEQLIRTEFSAVGVTLPDQE